MSCVRTYDHFTPEAVLEYMQLGCMYVSTDISDHFEVPASAGWSMMRQLKLAGLIVKVKHEGRFVRWMKAGEVKPKEPLNTSYAVPKRPPDLQSDLPPSYMDEIKRRTELCMTLNRRWA